MSKRLELTFVALLLCVGALLKIWFVLDVTEGDFGKVRFSDEATYYLPAAREIAAQGISYFLTERSLWNGPLNPLWIYALGQNAALVKAANILLLSISGLFIWGIIRNRSKVAALWALFIWGIYPPLIDFGPTLLTEPPYIFLISAAAFTFFKDRTFATGLLLGAATLVRPTTQLLPVFLVAAACLPRLRFRREFLSVAAGMLILILPYIAKNYFLFGRATIANGFGAVFQLGTNLRTYGDEPIYSGIDFDTQRYTKEFTHLDSEGDRRLSSAAVQYIEKHPFDILKLMLVKPFKCFLGNAQFYFFPYNGIEAFVEYEANPWRIFFVLAGLLLTPLVTIIGSVYVAVCSYSASKFDSNLARLSAFSVVLVLYFAALHAVVFPIPRMALPLFPLLLIGFVSATPKIFNLGAITAIIFQLLVAFGGRGHLNHEYNAAYPSYFEERTAADIGAPVAAGDVEIVDGVIKVVGKDPYVVYSIDAATDRNQLILIELSILSPPKRGQKHIWGQVFWSDSDKFLESRSTPFLFRTTPGEARYRVSVTFNPAWLSTSVIRNLRVDLGERVKGLSIKVQRLEIAR